MKKVFSPSWILCTVFSLVISCGAYAVDNGTLPDTIVYTDDDDEKTCGDLEQEMTHLAALTYARQPNFYEDPIRGAAIMVGTTLFPLAYGVVGYQEFIGYEERNKITSTEQRIEQIRRLKAQRRCFES
ncbi:MAG: hypothetical protein ABW166_06700 [Sedimenticola sp.]